MGPSSDWKLLFYCTVYLISTISLLTSHSTQVGSLRVIQVGGFLFMIFGMLGKFGALFVTIPDPIIGGVFMVMFGMITAVGISNLQYADMNSSRNLFIVGFSLVFGLAVPYYMEDHMDAIQTGIGVAGIIKLTMSKLAHTQHLCV